MFKKKTQKPADCAERHDDLTGRLSAAEARLSALRTEAISDARTNPDKLAAHAENASRLEFEIAALTEALRQAERESAEAEEVARREADKRQRQQTSHDLRKLADGLEKAVAPVPDAMQSLQDAITAVLPIVGPNGLADLLGNLSVEIPAAVELFISELRARADQTLTGTAPPTLPARPVLLVIEEPLKMPTTTIFSLERLSWLVDGKRESCGPHQIHGLPTEAANIAIARGLAILPDSDRYKQMRAEAERTGWPHLADAQRVYDLDRDPNTATVYSSGGKKAREEQTFTRIDRGPPRQVFVTRPSESE
jgi:hypothetical protein